MIAARQPHTTRVQRRGTINESSVSKWALTSLITYAICARSPKPDVALALATDRKGNTVKRITIWNDGHTWQATFHDDSEVQRLFGTDTLPTAFTAQADGARVLAEVQRRNRHCRVSLAQPVLPYGDR